MIVHLPSAADGHEEAARWAVRLAEAPHDGAELAELQTWLAADPANADRLDDILQSWAAVDDYASHEPIMALRQDALAAISSGQAGDRHGWSWQGAMTAASLVLCMIAAGLWLSLRPAGYDTAIGERRVVTLDDGSTLSLDAKTHVSVDFSGARRELAIDQGRAKFNVAKDPLRPFMVRAGSKVVVAVGTSFSVERIGDRVQVILYEGRVAILDGQGARLRPVTLRTLGNIAGKDSLVAEQQVTLPLMAPATSGIATQIDIARTSSWEHGQLVFVDEPLATVVARVNRYAARPLRLGDEKVRGMRVSGVFLAGQSEGLTEGLKAAFGARIVQEPDAVAIFSAPGA